jgi:SAM-dependent methyltransferase
MKWHERYQQQAAWTRDLRKYVFERCDWQNARRVLEVGCGSGAVLQDPVGNGCIDGSHPELNGLDLAPAPLAECRLHVPAAHLVRADAASLPYPSEQFDITYCHFLLLWLREPLRAIQEMKRVTAKSGYVLALAEPDYSRRVDRPEELAWLGRRQNESLQRQGVTLDIGADLPSLFQQVGLRLIETGTLQSTARQALSAEEWASEWQVLEDDLADSVDPMELQRLRAIDWKAWQSGEHLLSVPTYFAWAQV